MLPITVVNSVVTFPIMRIRCVIVTKTIWSITWTKLSSNKTMSFSFKFTHNVCINEHFGLFKVSGITLSFMLQNYRKIMLIGGKGIINKIWAHTKLIWSFIPFNKRIECIISWCLISITDSCCTNTTMRTWTCRCKQVCFKFLPQNLECSEEFINK